MRPSLGARVGMIRHFDDPIEAALIYLLHKQSGAGSTRLQKLLYLAESEHHRRYGKPLTGAEFVKYHYGPWSPEVANAWDALEAQGVIKEQITATRNGYRCRLKKLSIKRGEITFPTPHAENVLNFVLDQFGHSRTPELAQCTKETPPFQRAEFAETLDLREGCPPPFSLASEIDWDTFAANTSP